MRRVRGPVPRGPFYGATFGTFAVRIEDHDLPYFWFDDGHYLLFDPFKASN
jgi:hypothetical protein